MPQDSIALGQDSPIQLNNGNVGGGVHLRNASTLVVRVFFERIPRVIIGYACVFPQEADNLAAASGLKVEIMDIWDASDGFVAGGFGAATLGSRHPECVRICV